MYKLSRLIARKSGLVIRFNSVLLLLGIGFARPVCAQFYQQTNLVSDVHGLAAFTDTNLVGAWGVAASGTSPWWVNSTMGHVSLLFNGAGQPVPLVVSVPPTNVSIATGIAFYGGSGFVVVSNFPSRFIFATINGVISGWSPNETNRSVAVVKVDNSGSASYTGLTIAQQDGQEQLYAANFAHGTIDVFDTNFTAVTLAPGAFTDERIPTNFTVFNIQLIGDELYVTYAPQDVFATFGGRGQGYVDVFDTGGMLLKRLQHGYWMNAPWGVALAPAGFGEFSDRILIGMFGNGAIAGFDRHAYHFRGFLNAIDGLPLRISQGLWGLGFGNGAGGGPTNTLYFASDFSFAGAFHGLFGALTLAPDGDGDGDGDNGDAPLPIKLTKPQVSAPGAPTSAVQP